MNSTFKNNSETCPLCNSINCNLFYSSKKRLFFQCKNCSLIFVPKRYHLSSENEKNRYSYHNNSIHNTAYLKHLEQIVNPIKTYSPPPSTGLDFGSGPSPVLSTLLQELNYNMKIYDPYFAKHTENLTQKYNFIVCSEVVEHFSYPLNEWQKLINLLLPNSFIYIMTKLYDSKLRFSLWRYKDDLTHVSFYTKDTFSWIESNFPLKIQALSNQVGIFQQVPSYK